MVKKTTILGNEIKFEINSLAQLSDVSILATMGGSAILVTIMIGKKDDTLSYFPLKVDYLERDYASGIISGSRFVKREGFPSPDAVLKARMIDRAIRPLFPDDYKNPVYLTIEVLSYDKEFDPMILALNTVSLAFVISKAPFITPIAGLRVIKENDELKTSFKVVSIDNENYPKEHLNIVAGTDSKGITMIDADMMEISKEDVLGSCEMIIRDGREFVEYQQALAKELKIVKQEYVSTAPPVKLLDEMTKSHGSTISKIVQMRDKRTREESLSRLIDEITEGYNGKFSKSNVSDTITILIKKAVKKLVLKDGKRIDGRAFDEVRKLEISVGVLPRTHGSALFKRGGTQVMSIATIASESKAQTLNSIEGESMKTYMHFYNDSPFCFGQAESLRYYPSRRAIGHGALAEKALVPMLPSSESFPYVIRVVSEILMSAGSTSMASTCASTLALMDVGVPIKNPVAGIAVGLIAEHDFSDYTLLLDAAEGEDFYGQMDFKVTGTRDGITAIQMDNKIISIPLNILKESLNLAERGRIFVLDKMSEVIAKPRENLSKFAPRVTDHKINPEKVGELIGPGGKNIKAIIESTGAQIDISEDGNVRIFALDDDKIKKTIDEIDDLVGELEEGKVYTGTVVNVTDFGAFVEVKKGVSGLVHKSEMANKFVRDPKEIVKVGDVVKVKVVHSKMEGKISFTMKNLEIN